MTSPNPSASESTAETPLWPDFSFWSRNPYWTLEEGVALSLGIDPNHLSSLFATESEGAGELIAEYHRRLQIAERAQTVGDLWLYPTPGFFIGWLKGLKLYVPDALVQHVAALGYQIADWRGLLRAEQERTIVAVRAFNHVQGTLIKERGEHAMELKNLQDRHAEDQQFQLNAYSQLAAVFEETHREAESLRAAASAQQSDAAAKPNPKTLTGYRKLTLGMAIDGYGYDPRAERSPIPAQLVDHLAKLGISLGEDSVRKYLKDAHDELGVGLQDPTA